MTHRAARFEIVRSDAPQPWHGRFIAGNGRIIWHTETYTRRGKVVDAIMLLGADAHAHYGTLHMSMNDGCYEVRDVDERAPRP